MSETGSVEHRPVTYSLEDVAAEFGIDLDELRKELPNHRNDKDRRAA